MMKKNLWILAGAEVDILEKSSDKDKLRFLLIGIVLVFLFIISFISIYYILTLSTESIAVNVSVSLMWALLMTNLNRLIFMSSRRRNLSKLKMIYFIIPRLILPTLIAIILSLPIQVKLFEGQIEERIKNDRQKEVLKTDNKQYGIELSSLRKLSRTLERDYFEKLYIERDTIGRNFLALRLDMKIDSINELITKKISKYEIEKQKTISEKIGFILGLTTLNKIRKESGSLNVFFITSFILILLIELLPIIINNAYTNSTYDSLLEEVFKNHQNFPAININNNEEVNNEEAILTSDFERHCNRMINDLDIQINNNTEKATELLRNGIIIIISGILGYSGALYYLGGVFFEKNEIKPNHFYLMISTSLLFLFIQFLGGWFLKQYRRSINISLFISASKPNFERFLLSYSVVCEFSAETERKELIKELLEIFNNVKEVDRNSGILASNNIDNYPNDIIKSINSLMESINKTINKK